MVLRLPWFPLIEWLAGAVFVRFPGLQVVFSESYLGWIRFTLEHCDRQRFAPQPTDQHEKSRILERVGTLMTTIDKAVR